MTLEELQRDWKNYKIIISDGTEVKMADILMVCRGSVKDGLLFDSGGEQGSPALVLKPDEEDNCYMLNTDGGWDKMGKFVKIVK